MNPKLDFPPKFLNTSEMQNACNYLLLEKLELMLILLPMYYKNKNEWKQNEDEYEINFNLIIGIVHLIPKFCSPSI